MPYLIDYWDNELKEQRTRMMTAEEEAEFLAAAEAEAAAAPARARAEKWEAIKAERDRRKFAGVKVGEHWIHTDTFSRTQWLGMLLMGAALPSAAWSTLDNSEVMTTPEMAQAVAAATAAQDMALFDCARTKRAELDAAEDPAAYDVLAGWPAGFGEEAE